MQVGIGAGTVNRGSDLIGSGIVANDWIGFLGYESTAAEVNNLE